MNSSTGGTKFRIGEWIADPERNLLVRDTRTAHVEPRVMDILVCLARNQGQLVTPHQLVREVWAGTIVSDGPVYQGIARLRRVLDDDPQSPRYIETIPKRGYRLLATVTPLREPGEIPDRGPGPMPVGRSRWLAAGLLAGAIGLVMALAGPGFKPGSGPRHDSIAVLPFLDLSDGQDKSFLAEGISEELIHALANLPDVRVTSRTSSFSFRGRAETIESIGRMLGVDTVLEGSIRTAGNRIRVTAQLIDVANGSHIWSQRFDTGADDILKIQDSIAKGVIGAMYPGRELSLMPRRVTTRNQDAYISYHLGRFHARQRQVDSLQKALGYFRDTTRLDPEFALAWVAQADTHRLLSEMRYGNLPTEEAYALSMAALNESFALRDDLADAWFSMGDLRLWEARNLHQADESLFDRRGVAEARLQYARVEDAWSRGITLAPDSHGAHLKATQMARWRHDLPGQLEHLQAAATKDPLSAVTHLNLGEIHLKLNDTDAAIREVGMAMELAPAWHMPLTLMAYVHAGLGRQDEALRWFIRALRAEGLEARLGRRIAAEIASILTRIGEYRAAERWLGLIEPLSPGAREGRYPVLDLMLASGREADLHDRLDHWLNSYPSHLNLHVYGALYETLMGHDEHALRMYETAAGIDDIWVDPLQPNSLLRISTVREGYLPALNLARLYLAAGRSGDAATHLDAAQNYLANLDRIVPDLPAAMYLSATVLALRNDRARAVAKLRQAISHGWQEAQRMRRDPNLVALREEPGFCAILAKLEKQEAAMIDRVRRVAHEENLDQYLRDLERNPGGT